MGGGPNDSNYAAAIDQPTIAAYDRYATDWVAAREATHRAWADSLAGGLDETSRVLDLGCGPGWYSEPLGRRAIAFDASAAMLALAQAHAPAAEAVRGSVTSLPFRSQSFAAAIAAKVYIHLPHDALPLALADLHRCLTVRAPVLIQMFKGVRRFGEIAGDPFAGRRFAWWSQAELERVFIGAGFAIRTFRTQGEHGLVWELVRERTLPDFVGPNMRVLCVGLNPSEYAADRGVGFARPGNRFWPAALAAGIVTRDRDPRHALAQHGIGMTDLVKRATPRADALSTEEYRAGYARIDALVGWLQPSVLCFVGLSGYRAAVDRKAKEGWQHRSIGATQVYVMPNPSGLNAHATIDSLAAHLREAASARR